MAFCIVCSFVFCEGKAKALNDGFFIISSPKCHFIRLFYFVFLRLSLSCFSVSQSISPSLYFVYLVFHLFSKCLFLSFYVSFQNSLYLSDYFVFHLSVCLTRYLYTCNSACISTCLSICPSVFLNVCLSIFVRLNVKIDAVQE